MAEENNEQSNYNSSEEEAKRKQEQLDNFRTVMAGGYTVNDDLTRNIGSINAGAAIGQKEFMDDPEMQKLKAMRERYAQGYSGEELGNIRETARGELAGAQKAQQRQLAGAFGRGGVGGARGAAMMGQAAQQGVRGVADAERKMAMDSAQIQRQGANDLQDFVFKQKLGKSAYAMGIGQQQSAANAANVAAAANKGGGSSCLPTVILFTCLSGMQKAEAMELISLSKGNAIQQAIVMQKCESNPVAKAFINDLQTIRFVRDNYCTVKELRGFYQVSEILAPMVEKRPLVAKILNTVLVEPAKAVKSEKMSTRKLVGLAWIKVWGLVASNEPFKRSNGEVI